MTSADCGAQRLPIRKRESDVYVSLNMRGVTALFDGAGGGWSKVEPEGAETFAWSNTDRTGAERC